MIRVARRVLIFKKREDGLNREEGAVCGFFSERGLDLTCTTHRIEVHELILVSLSHAKLQLVAFRCEPARLLTPASTLSVRAH